MSNKVFFIGISGGTGSGKTSISKNIISRLSKINIALIEQDFYYKDLSEIELKERSKINFDHPKSIDFNLMKEQLSQLLNGKDIEVPIYDFTTHTRKNETQLINHQQLIIVEGIFSLFDSDICKMMDIKIYVDTDDDIRIIRRINRDINERKRTLSSITTQYYNTVRPMHIQFVEPTKKYADIIIPGYGNNNIAVDLICTK
jgi:uridine kinase